jgi:DNA adenine methylase
MYYNIFDPDDDASGEVAWPGPQRSPLKRFGGKAKMSRLIASLLPPHRMYVETHAGAAHVLFAKHPSETELLADLDPDLVELWHAVANPNDNEILVNMLLATPNTRDTYQRCRQEFVPRAGAMPVADRFERLRQYYVLTQCSYNGAFCGGWSRPSRVCDDVVYENRVRRLRKALHRMERVQVRCSDFRETLGAAAVQEPDVLVYADPPYVHATRSSNNRYRHEMKDDDHVELLRLLVRHPGCAIISGYRHELYERALLGWRVLEVPVAQHAARASVGTKKSDTVEVLWLNPRCWNASAGVLRQMLSSGELKNAA